ncbi:MAG: FHA domain-containing serine/threonine-protein kinase [Bacteroidota bacterium]
MAQSHPDTFHSDSQRYEVVREIGKGGFGRVYEVSDPSGNHYALKWVDLHQQVPDERAEMAEKFRLEYEITSKLKHPNIVQSHDFGQYDGCPFMVMDLCLGGNLYHIFANIWTYDDLRETLVEVLQGLHYAHQQGIVHRDLKPENILFSQQGVAKIADFGIAADVKNRRTRRDWRGYVSEVFATIPYSPPEQTDRKAAYHVYATNDIFALGVILFELITKGQYPFGSEEVFEKDMGITYQKRKEEGMWDRQVLAEFEPPDMWQHLIERCIQPTIEDRFQDATAMLKALGVEPEQTAERIESPFSSGPWHLVIKLGDQVGRTYHLSNLSKHLNKRRLTIGWYDAQQPFLNDIAIMENYTQYISKRHAILELSYPTQNTEQWKIRDGQPYTKDNIPAWHPSKNGTYLNGKQVDKHGKTVQAGDILTIGDFSLKFETG